MAKRGRPTLYDPNRHPIVARALCMIHNCTNEELCKLMGISNSTFHDWLKLHPEFSDAVKHGKLYADASTADSLFRRANGYDYEETEVVLTKGKNGESKPGRVKKTKKHIPPDVKAAIFWLTNRRPDLWRNISTVEASGPNGGPLEVNGEIKGLGEIVLTLAKLSPEERQARRRELERKLGIQPGAPGT